MPRKTKTVHRSPPLAPVLPAGENRRERFLRIAEPRVQRVLNSIRIIGNLATANYKWTDDDINRIQDAVVKQLGVTLARFERTKKPALPEFHFDREWEAEPTK